MKYRITITKIEEQPVLKSVYISDEELERRGDYPSPEGRQSNYRTIETVEKIEVKLYEQTMETKDENDLHLLDIINAFNGKRCE